VLGVEGVVSIVSVSVTMTLRRAGIVLRLKLYLHDDDNEEQSKMFFVRRAAPIFACQRTCVGLGAPANLYWVA
jgi:hypothetical protein